MKAYLRTIIYIILMSLLMTHCSLNQETSVSTTIEWENLQITPKANDDLCAEMLPEEMHRGFEESKRSFTSGTVTGILPKNLSQTHKIANRTYWVDANKQLVLNWIFWYPKGNTGSLDLRLFVLLDEYQLTSALPNLNSYMDLHLERGDEVTVQVTIPPLASGAHDVIAMAVPFPEADPADTGLVNLMPSRITVIAEPTSSPFRKISFVSLPAEGSIKKGDPELTLVLSLQKNGLKVWNWPDPWLNVHPNTSTPFYALMGHQDVTNADAQSIDPLNESFFALLFFVDYQQIEIAPGQMVFYGRTDKDTAYGRIPLEIPPLPQGKHHILALRIDTPGVPKCLMQGDPKGRFLPDYVDGSLVGINVLSSE